MVAGFCYQENFSNPTMPIDEARFYALVRAAKWNEYIDRFRQTGDQSLKRKLPAFIFQATFTETVSKSGKRGCWRKQAATCLTGLVVMDVDHVDAPRETWERIDNGQLTIDNELRKRILLVYITPSGHGLKIVFKADVEQGNLIDNQHAMAKVLGVEVDESCKDASRMSFICKESDILYIDKELFTYENKAFGEKYDEEYRAGKSQATVQNEELRVKNEELNAAAQNSSDCEALPIEGERGGGLYHGIPYQKIVEAWIGDKKIEQGDRHRTSLVLADHLRYITDNDPKLIEQILSKLLKDPETVTL